jgi:hypothetical protein
MVIAQEEQWGGGERERTREKENHRQLTSDIGNQEPRRELGTSVVHIKVPSVEEPYFLFVSIGEIAVRFFSPF